MSCNFRMTAAVTVSPKMSCTIVDVTGAKLNAHNSLHEGCAIHTHVHESQFHTILLSFRIQICENGDTFRSYRITMHDALSVELHLTFWIQTCMHTIAGAAENGTCEHMNSSLFQNTMHTAMCQILSSRTDFNSITIAVGVYHGI